MNKVYPNLGLDLLDFSVIQKAKKLAVSKVDNHAWTDMSEEEILRSSGLILTDPDTGKEGITLAAILLFGKDSTIMSVLPQYKTGAIFRVNNVDRYDDREVVITNLIDSYRRLMDFGKKHLNDVFVLEGDQTKMYSGGTPVFTEDNIFEIVIPVSGVADLTVGPSETDKETNKETNKEIADKIIDIMKETPEFP